MSRPTLAVIPARLASSRLPRKPLYLLAGRPLLEWVWRRVVAMDLFEEVVIAADSEEIVRAAEAFGATVELTDPAHPSGTDRIAEVARRARYARYEVIANVQGDEPFIRADQVEPAIRAVRDRGWELATVATPITTPEELHNPAVVKVVLDSRGGAMYFSRAAIPHLRDAVPAARDFGAGLFLRHLGIYVYQRDALLRWVSLPEAPLERVERLEQLRPLAASMAIAVERVAAGPAGVDTPEDAVRADSLLRADPVFHTIIA
jgi:3-deoxy-manno-octulosonate cytidylyltransferase (CMP-KDO synthetase)